MFHFIRESFDSETNPFRLLRQPLASCGCVSTGIGSSGTGAMAGATVVLMVEQQLHSPDEARLLAK